LIRRSRSAVGALALAIALTGCARAEHDNSTSGGSSVSIPTGLLAVVNHRAPGTELGPLFHCSGVLISAGLAITANHCVNGLEAADVDVVLELQDLCHPEGIEPRVSVRRIGRSPTTDLAALWLEVDAEVTPTPVAGTLDDGDQLFAWGWGRQSPGGPLPCHATAKPLKRTDDNACEHDGVQLSDGQICATPTGGRNTCSGDSGGPVLDQRGELVAIVSGGKGCGVSDPGSYSVVDTTTLNLLLQ
jgi:S1-C subfamily serine protease